MKRNTKKLSALSMLTAGLIAFSNGCAYMRGFVNQDYNYKKPDQNTREYNGLRIDFPRKAEDCGFTLDQIVYYGIKIDPITEREINKEFKEKIIPN